MILKAVITTFLSMLLLFFLTKLTGDKQISQMSMFDYITGITIGSAGAEMAIGGDIFIPATIVTLLYGVVAFLMSFICNKSIRARRFINGEPMIIYLNGIFYKKNMARCRMDMGEFLTQCRNNGYFSVNDIACAIMEPNGKISFLPETEVEGKCTLINNVVIDGNILEKNLRKIGKSREWLLGEIKKKGIRLEEILLASYENSVLCVYPFKTTGGDDAFFE